VTLAPPFPALLAGHADDHVWVLPRPRSLTEDEAGK
jgi:hypothetical protein